MSLANPYGAVYFQDATLFLVSLSDIYPGNELHLWHSGSEVSFSELLSPHLSSEGCEILCELCPAPLPPPPRQCSVSDLNRDPVSSVFRAGPQPRSCEASVPRRTSTAIL